VYAVRHSSPGRPAPRRAAAAAEIAILGSVLALVMVISIDFARLFLTYLTVTNCAYAGAMYGSQDTTHSTNTTGIQSAAVAEGASLSPALASANVSSTTGNDANSDPYVSVTVTYSSFTTLITYPGVPHTMTLSRTVQMRVTPSVPGTQN
jgi:Flp pilus assembly protein TadG